MPVSPLRSALRGTAAALAIAAAIVATPARADDFATNAPSLATQAFQQIDGNGVDLINGAFQFKGPEASAGSGAGEVSLGLKWNGRMWDLGTPSIWVDEDKSLFIDNGRYVDEFEFSSGVGWKSARGNASKIDCIFWDQDRTQMDRCTYKSHDGISIFFGAPSPYGGLPQTFSLGMGNVRAYNASVSYPDGQFFFVNAYSNNISSQSNLGFGIQTGELYKPQVTMSVRKKPNVANYGLVFGPVVAQITVNTPGIDYDDRYDESALAPKGVTQTMVDTLNQTWSFTFSSGGNLTSVQRPGLSAPLTIGYDGDHRVTSFSNGAQTWGYAYSSNNGVGTTTVTDPNGGQTIVTYVKKKGNVRSVRDPKFRTTTYDYDPSNRLWKVTFPELNYTVYGYDSRGNITSITNYPKPSVGGTPLTTVQAFYPPTCPDGGSCNKPDYVIDANNNRWDFKYQGALPLVVTKPAPAPGGVRPETRFTYTPLNAQAMTDQGMRQASPAVPVLTSISECRTLAGGTAPACANTADEKRTTIGYGTLDGSVENYLWPVTTTVAAGDNSISQTVTTTYDSAGNVLTEDGPLAGPGDATRSIYDAGRRMVGSITPDPDGAATPTATRKTYNGLDQPVLVEAGPVADQSDAAWAAFSPLQRTATAYDAQGRPVTVASAGTGATQTVTHTSYDTLGRERCTAVRMDLAAFPTIYAGGTIAGGGLPTDACTPDPTPGAQGPDRIERKNYNPASELTSIERAVGTSVAQTYATYTYSDNGKRLSMTDANGNPASMTYDGHDRQTRWTFPSATSPGQLNGADYEEYSYDNNGNRLTLTKRDGKTISYSYDGLDRVVQKTAPVSSTGAAGYVVHYGYDNYGGQTFARFGSPSGPGVGNQYDALGRLTQSSTNVDGTLRTLNFGYDARGNRNSLSASSGSVGYIYDSLDRMTEIRENGSNTVVKFGYDSLGRRSSVGFGNGGVATSSADFAYDPVGRLQTLNRQLAGADWDQILGFDYNPASQITTRTNAAANDYASNTGVDVSRNYTVNGLNQYSQVGSYAYGYDANGNLKSHGTTNYVYDAENRLVSAAGGHNATLSYDPLGRLWQVAEGATATRFFYDGDRLFEEYSETGARLRSYVHGPGADEPLLWYEWTGGALRRFLHADHQGSIVAVADETGNAIKLNGYDSWGHPNPLNQKRFQYTGQVWLPELGLYYYKARLYSPVLGRFFQTDPIGYEDQVNLYAYVGNDPLNSKDPSGSDCISANGVTTCATSHYKVSFPTQRGWQDFTSSTKYYHTYSTPAESTRGVSETRQWVQNHPVPGSSNRATARGVVNDATPGTVSARNAISPVMSFSTINQLNGLPVVVNVTLPGHPLKHGVVVRQVTGKPSGGSIINNWGEGTAKLQSPDTIQGQIFGPAINGVWRGLAPPDPRYNINNICAARPSACLGR